jgi:hypothetical protein
MRRNHSQRIAARTAILLLLVALVGLSALARHSQYLPKSDPTHYFSNSTKMEIVHLPVLFFPSAIFPARVVPDEPAFQRSPREASQRIGIPQIGLVVSLQHRSPPFLLV